MSRPKAVEFDCGRLNFDPATKKVTPDARRGRAKVFINSEGEKHFEWRDLKTNKAELDQFMFEQDAKFSKVQKSTGRVYYLHFNSYEDKYFFWMQEKDETKDEDICKRVNALINWEEGAMEEEVKKEEPKPAATSSTAGGASNNKMGNQQAADLSKMFSEAMAGLGQNRPQKESPSLNDILSSQFLDEIAKDPEFKEALKPHLPESQRDDQGIKDNLKSAQLQQAIDTLDEALNSEEIMTVLVSLGLDTSVLKNASDGTDALVKALALFAKKEAEKK